MTDHGKTERTIFLRKSRPPFGGILLLILLVVMLPFAAGYIGMRVERARAAPLDKAAPLPVCPPGLHYVPPARKP